MTLIRDLRTSYCQAERCWRSNNLRACLQICGQLSKDLSTAETLGGESPNELAQVKNLVWFLEIKCLSEDYHLNESLLLNEDDNQSDEQVRTFTSNGSRGAQRITPATRARGSLSRARVETAARRGTMASNSRVDTRGRQMTQGMLTGRMPTRSSSRQSGRATSSYRPLTTSLTASQTAFSRSTRPLIKYASCHYLSKLIYDYLYNAQKATSKCPDYRQCLEFLNYVPASSSWQKVAGGQTGVNKLRRQQGVDQQLVSLSDESLEAPPGQRREDLGAFWCISFGVCYFSLRMHKQAEEHFQLALRRNPKYLDPYLWLIKVYMRLNQYLKVLKTCDEGLVNSRNAILFNWKARIQMLLNEFSMAHVSLRESLAYYPTNIEALANVGHYSFYGDKYELALKCYERINQLCVNLGSLGVGGDEGGPTFQTSAAELCNNLALSNFYCGNYTKVMPLFQRAFLSSPGREVTSDIWYNISFIPISFGSRELAIACLRLALKNDSQNEDAINNLGCLKYDSLINDPLHYGNRQEYWSGGTSTRQGPDFSELKNRDDQRKLEALYDEAEAHFRAPLAIDENDNSSVHQQPEMLFNMAVLKRKRGQLMDSARYCEMYMDLDDNNYTIRRILENIHELVSHDS